MEGLRLRFASTENMLIDFMLAFAMEEFLQIVENSAVNEGRTFTFRFFTCIFLWIEFLPQFIYHRRRSSSTMNVFE